MVITFKKSVAPFGYAYSEGDTADLQEAVALEFIERGFAIAAKTEDFEQTGEDVKQAVQQPAATKKAVKTK